MIYDASSDVWGWCKANRTTLKSPSKNNVDKKENQQRFSFQRSVWVTYILESCQHVDLR